MAIWIQFIIQAIFSYVSTVCFGVCMNVPRKALLTCGIGGMFGWQVYWVLFQLGTGRMAANLFGALVVGLCGSYLAKKQKMPVILFNIPSLVPLVPGGTAYQAIRNLVLGETLTAIQLLVSVIMIAGSIAVGFMLAQIITELSYRQKPVLKK